MKKLVKTSAVFNTPGESNMKLMTACVASKVTAAANGHIIHVFQF